MFFKKNKIKLTVETDTYWIDEPRPADIVEQFVDSEKKVKILKANVRAGFNKERPGLVMIREIEFPDEETKNLFLIMFSHIIKIV
jgi:hypothetical protein